MITSKTTLKNKAYDVFEPLFSDIECIELDVPAYQKIDKHSKYLSVFIKHLKQAKKIWLKAIRNTNSQTKIKSDIKNVFTLCQNSRYSDEVLKNLESYRDTLFNIVNSYYKD